MSDKIIVNAATGEIIERDFTDEEKSQRAIDEADNIDLEKEQAAQKIADQAAREAAIAHAKSLGFTDAMIAVMYPNLGATS
jgi:hypothetical protein